MWERIDNGGFESLDHQVARGLPEIAFQRNEYPFFIRKVFREVPPVFIVEQANHAPGDHAIIFAYLTFSEKKVSFGQIETYENVGQFFVSFRAEWSGLSLELPNDFFLRVHEAKIVKKSVIFVT